MILSARKIQKLCTFATAQPLKLLLFGGQGTQQLNMLSPLLKIPLAQKQIQNYSGLLNIDFVGITSEESRSSQLKSTDNLQPLIVMQQCLRMKYLWTNETGKQQQKSNIYKINNNNVLIGHSIGQYSALVVSGAINLQQCLKLVHKRGQLMLQHTNMPSAMLFIRFSTIFHYILDEQKRQTLSKILEANSAEISCFNTNYNIITGGQKQKLIVIRDSLKIAKITSIFLPVSSAFHCKMLEPMRQPYKKLLEQINFQSPLCKIIRNYDTKVYENKADIIEGLVQHLTNPVKFYQSIQKIDKSAVNGQFIDFEQIGLKQNLSKFIKQIRKNRLK